ncbi:MAG: E3 binding domain-containing protein [Deltaproteobacteria bacterium]|nr:E3 binding domain-containing protein [Deltaproteobacteria bacterium]
MTATSPKGPTVVGAIAEELSFEGLAAGTSVKGAMTKISVVSKIPPALPRTRRLAKELGVALETVVGTGPSGIITEKDVVGAL